MIKKLRGKTPFILLASNLILVICQYLGIYNNTLYVLGNLVGYSIITNLDMFDKYNNRKYCTSTKFVILGLISLNIFDCVWWFFDVNGVVYDLFLIIIILLVLVIHKFKI